MKIDNGEIKSLSEESIEYPDIHVNIESDVFINILNKKASPMNAYVTGKLKAKGTLTDLLNLQKVL